LLAQVLLKGMRSHVKDLAVFEKSSSSFIAGTRVLTTFCLHTCIFFARNITQCMVLMLILWLEKYLSLKEFCDISVKVILDIMCI